MASSASILVNAVAALAARDPGILRIWAMFRPVRDDALPVAYTMRVAGDCIELHYNVRLMEAAGRRMVSRFIYMECLRYVLGHFDSRRKPDMSVCKMASDIVTGTLTMRAFPVEQGENGAIVSLIPTYAKYESILAKNRVEYPNFNFNMESIYDALMAELLDNPGGSVGLDSAENEVAAEKSDELDPADDCGAGVSARDNIDSPEDSGKCPASARSAENEDSSPDVTEDNGYSPQNNDGNDDTDAGMGMSVGGSHDDNAEDVVRDLFAYSPDDGSWDGNPEVDGEMRVIVSELSKTGTMMNMVGASLMGYVEGRAGNLVKRATNTFRKFATSMLSVMTEETWLRPNRRYDDEMPGERRICRPKVLLAVDISGSMDINVCRAIGILRLMMRAFDLDVCFWNDRVTDPVHAKLTTVRVPASRGGTKPDVVLDMVAEKKLRYNGYVFITDCEFTWVRPELWKKIAIIRVANTLATETECEFPEWCMYKIEDTEL